MAPLLDQEKTITEVDGEVLSRTGCFAVIRVSDDSISPAKDTAAAAAGGKEKEEDRVELAQALFTAQPGMVQNPNGGVICEKECFVCK
jgi:hypothetical protein